MNQKEIMKLFEYIEKNTNVLDYEVDNWKIWGIIRVYIYSHMITERDEFNNSTSNKKTTTLNILEKLPATFNYLKSLMHFFIILHSKPKKCDILVRTFSHARRDKCNNKYKCIYLDDIIKAIRNDSNNNLNCFIMEELGPYTKHFSPQYNKVDFFSEGLRLYSIHKKRSYANNNTVNNIKNKMINELTLLENKDKKEELTEIINFLKKQFNDKIGYFLRMKHTYKKLFRKIKPKIFLTWCSYEHEGPVAAAKELGIVVVELQHGGKISKYHHGYIYSKHLLRYKKKFPIPDYLLTFGKHSTNMLLENSFRNKSEIITVGNPRIDYWKSKIDKKGDKVFNKVFVTSSEPDANFLIKFLRKTLEYLKIKGINIKIIVKLHPREKSSLEKWNKLMRQHDNLTIVKGDTLNLYEFILNSDFHMTISSSTHYDAINMGKPTAVLGMGDWKMVSNLLENNIAKLIKTPEDFVELFQHATKKDKFYKSWLHNTIKESKIYQKDNAIENCVKAIKKILRSR